MNRILTALVLIVATVSAASIAGCDSEDGGESTTALPTAASSDITNTPAASGSITLTGALTLDGAPLDAPFLGARVVHDGLAAACQDEIPAVAAGRYAIAVASEREVRGCGMPGAEVLLWTYVDNRYLFSTEVARWPDVGSAVAFDAAFSSAAPLGASTPVTEFKGRIRDANNADLPAGTVVEAYAGDTRCAVTSLRPVEQTEGFYTLVVAGPDAVPGCDRDATLSFRLDGKPAAESAVNDLSSGADGHELDLTLK